MDLLDYILKYIGLIGFLVSLVALYFNWRNTSVNKKKFEDDKNEKKKADLYWNDISDYKKNRGRRNISIVNKGKATAKNVRVLIDGEPIKVYQKGERVQNGMGYVYHFKGIRLLEDIFPKNINSDYAEYISIETNLVENQSMHIKLVWDDDFGTNRENHINWVPGVTKIIS